MSVFSKAKTSALTLLLATLSTPVWAFNVDFSRSGDGFKAEVCGVSSGSKIELKNKRTGQIIGGRVSADGCFRTSFRDGNPGDEVLVSREDGSNTLHKVPGNIGGSSGGNAGGGYNPAPAPAPAPSIDIGKVRETAKGNARCTANQIVGTYGEAESFRYNLRVGIQRGLNIQSFSNLVFGGDITNRSEYREGLLIGQSEGQSEGAAAGQQQGAADGRSKGKADAYNRFASVVDTGNAPDKALRMPQPQFAGLQPSVSAPNLQASLDAKASRIEQIFRGMQFSYEGYVVTYDSLYSRWNSHSLWQSDDAYLTIKSWYRSEWAFDLFLRQTLGSRCEGGVDYYQKISSDYQAASAFQETFKREYDKVIDSKFIAKVQEPNSAAQQLGMQIAGEALSEHAREMGRIEGKRRTFQQASVGGFFNSFANSYEDAFTGLVQTLDTGAVITSDVAATLVDAKAGTNNFLVGAPVGVVVTRVTNVGRHEAQVAVMAAGQSLTQSQTQTFRLEASSSNKGQSLTISNVALISRNAAPDAPQTVALSVGGQQVSAQFTVSWENEIRALAKLAENGPLKVETMTYVSEQLQKEWKDIDDTFSKNHYENDTKTRDTLLERMVRVYKASDAQGQQNLSAAVQQLRKVIGSRPGMLALRKRPKWDTANALFEQMK